MPELWIPGVDGPHEDLVGRIHRKVADFLASRPAGTAEVEVDLRSGATVMLESISPEPGYGFVTLRPLPDEQDGGGEEWIVPVSSIALIRLREADTEAERVGFALPDS
ncbi:MAG: hypothetical protein M3R70_07275 [Actinomycetota bacterium]|nr:hypothetical protein [Actinomycetota bacterium]